MDKLEIAVQSSLGTLPILQIEVWRNPSCVEAAIKVNDWLRKNYSMSPRTCTKCGKLKIRIAGGYMCKHCNTVETYVMRGQLNARNNP